MPLAARRVPMVIIGMLSMAGAAWLGLVRLGWNLRLPWPDQLIAHGPLMVCGFLGTLVSLERAVALGARWGYAAPVLVAAGAFTLIVHPLGAFAPGLITAGSLVMSAIFVVVWRRHPSLFIATMTAGSVAWVVGNLQWLGGAAIYRVVAWWLAFLILTIAGERLELNRVLRPTPAVRAAFALAIATILSGAAASRWWPEGGVRVLGVGLLAVTWWLARYDVARRTVHQHGLTRFMAVCLLGGYAWLGIGGVIALVAAPAMPGVLYDAMLHAVFLGFVISMVFAHAPIIFPAVLGVPIAYAPRFYLHVAMLHVSLAVRLAGDLVESLGLWRSWGGLLSAFALVLFVLNMARSMAAAGRLRPSVSPLAGQGG
jgi:hypothetical protein